MPAAPATSNPSDSVAATEEVWVFGYGSLMWKPPIAYEKAVVGYIKQYVRRFWQHSSDHRGTPDAPGRVVTLIPLEEWQNLNDYHQQGEDDVTWGVAFKIGESDVETTRAYLDHREKNGYTVDFLDVYQKGQDEPVVRKAMVYIGTTTNEAYIGPAPLDRIALQIYKSYGPSGWNAEYLFNLADSLRRIAPEAHDEHIFELETKVRRLVVEAETSVVVVEATEVKVGGKEEVRVEMKAEVVREEVEVNVIDGTA